jgi:ubiquinone biosynthesis protein COQ9
MAIMAGPESVATAGNLLTELMQGLWEHVGDGSQGAESFAKMLALQAVYTTAELYMLADFSPGHADTWDALERRLADTAAVGKGFKMAEVAAMELRNRVMVFARQM